MIDSQGPKYIEFHLCQIRERLLLSKLLEAAGAFSHCYKLNPK